MTGPACIGIDGCRAGWVAATRDDVVVGQTLADLLPALGAVPGRSIVAIDMPIGLAATGQRECDVLARRLLAPARRASVFSTATRAAVDADSQAQASRINREHAAPGVSAQAFHLFPRIREVDRLLAAQPAWRNSIHEVHPELAFARWNAGADGGLRPMAHAKKSGLGAFDRLTLVFARYGRDAFERARRAHPSSRLADDDIADAHAALYSAERIAAGMHRVLPASPPTDDRGLPIRICF